MRLIVLNYSSCGTDTRAPLPDAFARPGAATRRRNGCPGVVPPGALAKALIEWQESALTRGTL